MKTEDIKRLLERYYNGETGEAEEKELRAFFGNNAIPKELEADKELFRQLDILACEKPPSLPEGLEEGIVAHIGQWERKERPATRLRTCRLTLFTRYAVTGIAAAMLLVVGIGIFYSPDSSPKDTFDDPQEAYAETQKALQLFAEALNKGTQQMEKAQSAVRDLQEKIDNIKKLRQ